MKKYDAIVCGGGFSGAAAAIAAARGGLSVLLIEQSNALGGAAVNCLVNPFMPFWTHKEVNGKKEKQYLSAGIFREIIDNLKAADALASNEMEFDDEYLKLLLNEMVLESGAELLFHTSVIGAKKNGNVVESITVSNKSGVYDIEADYFIDTTGDGDLCVLAGCDYTLGREGDNLCQPMTLCFRVANVDMDKFEKSRHTINPLYKEKQAAGEIKNIREDVLLFYTLHKGVIHFNSTRIVKKNPVNAEDVTLAEIEARKQAWELFGFLKDNIGGFEDSRMIMSAMNIGVRESRMIKGHYTVTQDDFVSCKKFDDSICVGNYDIDIHNPEGSGTSHYYFPDGQFYTIPYRALCPEKADNCLVAGRCISSTHEAQASYRIMPICTCLGEAAGTAVAVLKKSGTKRAVDGDVAEIRRILTENGAVV